MQFQITEMLGLNDVRAVLQALERRLRSVTGIVERNGDQVMTFGMGRSPLGFRWEDQTSFRAYTEEGRTTVTGLVRYDPDLFMNGKAQADRVRELIEETLERMRIDLKVQRLQPTMVTYMDAGAETTLSETVADKSLAGLTGEVVEKATDGGFIGGGIRMEAAAKTHLAGWKEAARCAELAYGFGLARRAAAARAEEAEAAKIAETESPKAGERGYTGGGFDPPVVRAEIAAEARMASGGGEMSHAGSMLKSELAAAVVAKQVEGAPLHEVSAVGPGRAVSAGTFIGEKIAHLRRRIRDRARPQKSAEDEAGHAGAEAGRAIVLHAHAVPQQRLIIAAMALAVAGGLLVSARKKLWQPVEVRTAATSDVPATSPASQAAVPLPTPSVVDKRLWVKPEKDLTVWVQDWAAALQSRDTESQGSYYSSRVENYLGVQAASREFIIQDKTAALKQRQHLSLIKVEQVRVEKQTDSKAVLRLVKHTITQTQAAGVSETFVQTRLKVVNQGGVWQIVDEQDMNNDQATNRNARGNSSTPVQARQGVRGRQSA
jgi:hypothetical protein